MDLMNVEKALEGLRIGLKKDGADLVVNSLSNDCVELSLVFKDDTCLECIVGSEILMAKVQLALGKAFQKVPRIVLTDPRKIPKKV